MSGILAVYSLVISVLIAQDLQPPVMGSNYSLFKWVSRVAKATDVTTC
jgi:V-type H+-transporting ATPase proteolipid subunit